LRIVLKTALAMRTAPMPIHQTARPALPSTEDISWMPWDEYENAKSDKAFLEDPVKKYKERE
jgi:hypothetical protein